VLAEFRRRYGDAKGIWVTRSREASQELYGEYGLEEKIHFDEKDVIVDLGYDGTYILDKRTPEELSQLDIKTTEPVPFLARRKKRTRTIKSPPKPRPPSLQGTR